MPELLDPKCIDPFAYDKGYLAEIRQYSLLPDNRIGWNYCMDYTWVAMKCEDFLEAGMKVVDVGCGPGAINGYLEAKHNLDIIGIDQNRWKFDYVDIVGDFTDRKLREKHDLTNLDTVISVSAFEHNCLEDHRRVIDACLECLRSGGLLVATFAATYGKSRFFAPSSQWNLSKQDIESIYGKKFLEFRYWRVWWRWRKHRELSKAYKARYGSWSLFAPPFLSAGAAIIKA